MAARKDQRKLIIDEGRRLGWAWVTGCRFKQRDLVVVTTGTADPVDCLAACGGEQPGAGPIGSAVDLPLVSGLGEGLLGTVLRKVEVAQVPDQRGHKPWPLGSEDLLDARHCEN